MAKTEISAKEWKQMMLDVHEQVQAIKDKYESLDSKYKELFWEINSSNENGLFYGIDATLPDLTAFDHLDEDTDVNEVAIAVWRDEGGSINQAIGLKGKTLDIYQNYFAPNETYLQITSKQSCTCYYLVLEGYDKSNPSFLNKDVTRFTWECGTGNWQTSNNSTFNNYINNYTWYTPSTKECTGMCKKTNILKNLPIIHSGFAMFYDNSNNIKPGEASSWTCGSNECLNNCLLCSSDEERDEISTLKAAIGTLPAVKFGIKPRRQDLDYLRKVFHITVPSFMYGYYYSFKKEDIEDAEPEIYEIQNSYNCKLVLKDNTEDDNMEDNGKEGNYCTSSANGFCGEEPGMCYMSNISGKEDDTSGKDHAKITHIVLDGFGGTMIINKTSYNGKVFNELCQGKIRILASRSLKEDEFDPGGCDCTLDNWDEQIGAYGSCEYSPPKDKETGEEVGREDAYTCEYEKIGNNGLSVLGKFCGISLIAESYDNPCVVVAYNCAIMFIEYLKQCLANWNKSFPSLSELDSDYDRYAEYCEKTEQKDSYGSVDNFISENLYIFSGSNFNSEMYGVYDNNGLFPLYNGSLVGTGTKVFIGDFTAYQAGQELPSPACFGKEAGESISSRATSAIKSFTDETNCGYTADGLLVQVLS